MIIAINEIYLFIKENKKIKKMHNKKYKYNEKL